MTVDTTNVSISETMLNIQPSEQEVLYDKIKNELSKFGLTSNQSKVFLYFLS